MIHRYVTCDRCGKRQEEESEDPEGHFTRLTLRVFGQGEARADLCPGCRDAEKELLAQSVFAPHITYSHGSPFERGRG